MCIAKLLLINYFLFQNKTMNTKHKISQMLVLTKYTAVTTASEVFTMKTTNVLNVMDMVSCFCF